MAVEFKELDGSPEETWDEGGFKASRIFLCPWDERNTFATELFGSADSYGAELRTRYPQMPGVIVMKVQFKRFASDILPQELVNPAQDLQRYKTFAKATVNYEFLDPNALDIQNQSSEITGYMTYRLDYGCDAAVIPGRGLRWKPISPGDPPESVAEQDVATIKRSPVIEHHLEWHAIARPPVTAIRNCIGSVNADWFLGAQPKTLLFDGVSMDQEFVLFASLLVPKRLWKLSYLFRELRITGEKGKMVATWGWLYRSLPAAKAGWYEVCDPVDFRPFYGRTDFATLIHQEPGAPDQPKLPKPKAPPVDLP